MSCPARPHLELETTAGPDQVLSLGGSFLTDSLVPAHQPLFGEYVTVDRLERVDSRSARVQLELSIESTETKEVAMRSTWRTGPTAANLAKVVLSRRATSRLPAGSDPSIGVARMVSTGGIASLSPVSSAGKLNKIQWTHVPTEASGSSQISTSVREFGVRRTNTREETDSTRRR